MVAEPIRLALLEDDAAHAHFIQSLLVGAGHECSVFITGTALTSRLSRPHDFDILILDWEVPDLSGLDILLWVRANLGYALPVMFATSRSREEDIVMGLRSGADDYMIKPIQQHELLARVSALFRRMVATPTHQSAFSCGPYRIDPTCNVVSIRGQAIELTRKEYELALLFFRNPGRLFSRDALAASVWNREIPAMSRTLDTHLSKVRRKLSLRPENGVRLISSYTLGYRLEVLADGISVSTQ